MEKPSKITIKKFFENKCSEDEYNLIMDYLNSLDSDELNLFMDSHLKEIESKKLSLNEDPDLSFEKLLARINIQNFPKASSRKKIIYYAAASIIFLVLISRGLLYYTDFIKEKQNIMSWNEKETALGEKFIISFIDGSQVTLHPKSRLKYPSKFANNCRELYLEGEAYFEVQRDSCRPFIVHSGNLTTTVLGTKFNVNAKNDNNTIEVSLVEGKVKISSGEQSSKKDIVILKPDQQLVYDKEAEVGTVNQFNIQKVIGWKDNILIYDDENLTVVFKELEEVYGIKFELAEQSCNSIRITANFKNDAYQTVIEVIKKLTQLEYRIIKENNEIQKIVFFKK